MNLNEVVIVINPGSTSTKIAVWTRENCLHEKVVEHDTSQLAENIPDQLDCRQAPIDEELIPRLKEKTVVGVVGRGGLLKPLRGGIYEVNDAMLNDLREGRYGAHASNLGAILANHYAERFGVRAFIVDPVTVDEFPEIARISGVPWIRRKSRAHALNIKAVSRRAALKLKKSLEMTAFVVAHMGGGVSIAAVQGGRIIDVNDALHGMGPFSPERAGALPIGPLVEACYSGEKSKKELLTELARHSGLKAYCGTSDVREVISRIDDGDTDAKLALEAMIYQNAKEIAAMAVVLKGNLDAVILTGGLVHSGYIVTTLTEYVGFLEQVLVFPGEGEMQALAEGAFRVIDDVEKAQWYV